MVSYLLEDKLWERETVGESDGDSELEPVTVVVVNWEQDSVGELVGVGGGVNVLV